MVEVDVVRPEGSVATPSPLGEGVWSLRGSENLVERRWVSYENHSLSGSYPAWYVTPRQNPTGAYGASLFGRPNCGTGYAIPLNKWRYVWQ